MDRLEHKRYKAKLYDHETLWQEVDNQWLKGQAPVWHFDDEEAVYIAIYHNGMLLNVITDSIRAEGDALRRDLNTVPHVMEQAYLLGFNDGLAGKFSKPPAAKPRRVKA